MLKIICKKSVLCVLLFFALVSFHGALAAETIEVSTPEDLSAACRTINTNGGEYTISLQNDIANASVNVNYADAVVTLVGNDHTLSANTVIATVSKGILHLGDGITGLTLQSDGAVHNEDPGLIHIYKIGTDKAECHIYDKVLLKDRRINNQLGGGVSVRGGEFYMHGGTIQNCGTYAGSVAFGGGVAVYAGGTFIMDGGIFASAYYYTNYSAMVAPNHSTGMNSETGLYINDSTISGNDANVGGGIFVMVMNDTEKQHIQIQKTDITDNTAAEAGGLEVLSSDGYDTIVKIEDCTITGNVSDTSGGGIWLTEHAAINMTGDNIICNNKADPDHSADEGKGKGADIYNEGTINDLASASAMNQTFQTSGYPIDGWYRDEADARWSQDDPSTNKYLGDTYDFSQYQSLIAAYTPYNEIRITKIWDDHDDAEGLRPGSVKITLKNRDGLTGSKPPAPSSVLYKALRIELDIPKINSHSDVVAVNQQDGSYPVEGLGQRSGLLSDTALPGEGWSVIVRHNTLNSTEFGPFALIRELEPGDRIFVNRGRQQLIFEVYANEKISSIDFGSVKANASQYENTLTLMTCEDERPEGGYAARRIVSARILD